MPAPVTTDLTMNLFTPEQLPMLAKNERVKEPEEVTELVVWLVSRLAGGPTQPLSTTSLLYGTFSFSSTKPILTEVEFDADRIAARRAGGAVA